MIAALLILVPLLVGATWAFFRFVPRHADRKAVSRFNVASVTVALVAAGAWCVRTYVVMSPTVDAAWWPIIAALGALVIFPVVLGLAAALRKLVAQRYS